MNKVWLFATGQKMSIKMDCRNWYASSTPRILASNVKISRAFWKVRLWKGNGLRGTIQLRSCHVDRSNKFETIVGRAIMALLFYCCFQSLIPQVIMHSRVVGVVFKIRLASKVFPLNRLFPPAMLFLGFPFSGPHFKGKSSIWAWNPRIFPKEKFPLIVFLSDL